MADWESSWEQNTTTEVAAPAADGWGKSEEPVVEKRVHKFGPQDTSIPSMESDGKWLANAKIWNEAERDEELEHEASFF
jgi:hypothetical protein